MRPDCSSQGGFLIFANSEEEMVNGDVMPIAILDSHSKKLTRMCRSSLSAEDQASAAAVDELEWRKVFWATMINPQAPIEKGETLKMSGGKSITGGMH